MLQRSWLPVVLFLVLAVPAVILELRQNRDPLEADGPSSSETDSELDHARQQAVAAEQQSAFFAEQMDRLKTVLVAAKLAATQAVKGPADGGAAGETAPKADATLVQIQAALTETSKMLVALSQAQEEQKSARKASQDQLVTLLGQIRELAAKKGDTKDGVDPAALAAVQAKLDAMEQAGAARSGDLTKAFATFEASLKLLSTNVETQASVAKGDSEALDGITDEIGRVQDALAALSRDLVASRTGPAPGAPGAGGTGADVEPGENGPAGDGTSRAGGVSEESGDAARAPVVAQVRAADPTKGIVILGKGKTAGVQIGDRFEITRAGRVVGTVRVVRLWDAYCGAEVVHVVDGEQIASGDAAGSQAVDAGGAGKPGGENGDAAGKAPGDGATGSSVRTVPPQKKERRPPPPPPGGKS